MATTNILSGDALMLFVEGATPGTYEPMAVATSCTLTTNTDFQETSSKDHGINKVQEISGTSWEMTSENLFTNKDFKKLYDVKSAGTRIKVQYGGVSNYNKEGLVDVGGTYAGPWAMGGSYLYGYAFISSLTSNANHGEKATFSATFKGDGALLSYGTWA